MTTKICKKCGLEKDSSRFAKYRYNGQLLFKATCRECNKPNREKYYKNNAIQIIEYNGNYKRGHRCQVNKRVRERAKNDPNFKMRELVRSAIKMALKRSKNGISIRNYLSYSIEELKIHLERQFEPWMTWQNHGKYNVKTWDDHNYSTWTWQLDHIIPQSDLPYQSMTEENFQKCWALSNLRPLSAKQNVKDGPARIRHGGKIWS